MATFLTTRDILSKVDEIIREARIEIVLISPYWQLSPQITERISDASARGIRILIVAGSKLKPEEVAVIANLKNVLVRVCDKLHAKCYYNEDKMVLTSMNLYQYSEANKEMGIFVERKQDSDLFESAKNEAAYFIRSSVAKVVPSYKTIALSSQARLATMAVPKKDKGNCIRCGVSINYNAEKPLCNTCYAVWQKSEDYRYPENFCHCCGDNADTSMARPECKYCYKENTKKSGLF